MYTYTPLLHTNQSVYHSATFINNQQQYKNCNLQLLYLFYFNLIEFKYT